LHGKTSSERRSTDIATSRVYRLLRDSNPYQVQRFIKKESSMSNVRVNVTYTYKGGPVKTSLSINAVAATESAAIAVLKKLYPQREGFIVIALKQL
jgi:hypothetical protein